LVYDGDALIGEVNSSGAPIAIYMWAAAGVVSERRYDEGSPLSLWYGFGPQGEARQRLVASGKSLVPTHPGH
jgi:hypothetical protein